MLLGAGQQATAVPAAAAGWHGLGWDLPPLQETRSVDVQPGGLRSQPATTATAPTPSVSWPAAASADVELPPVAADASVGKAAAAPPVTIARGGRDTATGAPVAHAAGSVRVEVLAKADADRAGVQGMLVRLSKLRGDTGGPLDFDVDYRSFASAYGGDYRGRLRLVRYPACVLTTPDVPQCRQKTPLSSHNDSKSGHVTGQVAFATAETSAVVAAEAGDKGDGGDFKATDLKPAGSWSSGGSTGAFTYSYPIKTPAGPSGTGPVLSLDYSSDAVDGLTSATNNQASPIGDGWALSGGGFIERSYKSCADDLGGNNGQNKLNGDLCWFSDNATLSFGGANDMLVHDKDHPESWHTKIDKGAKIEKLTNAANGAQGGEAWKLTTLDGTQYFFGLNHLPGWQQGNPETRSTWTEPVYGNNSGEPCYHTAFADSLCANTAWRWNLDYAIDTHGNATAFYYDVENNAYAVNGNTGSPSSYVRGGYLSRVEYGFNTRVANVYSTAPARVVFGTSERCLPTSTFTCDPAQLTKDTATRWPDVPFDRICATGIKCLNASPTFFSRKRYTTITAQVADGAGGWKPVMSWALGQSYPTPGSGGSPALWLDSITETGLANTSSTRPPISLPSTRFHGVPKANRVDTTTGYTALTRQRIDSVTSSTGGVTSVTYAEPECVVGVKMPASPEDNKLACYPTFWTPGGATDPIRDWFNKFPVVEVKEDGNTPLSQAIVTHYDYFGGAAWHHDDNPLVNPNYRTWSQFRGYGDVKTTKGAASGDPSGPRTVTETRYLRGMEGVSVPSYWGESVTDLDQYAGFVREELTYLDGKVIEEKINDPWRSKEATATDGNGFQSFYTGTAVQRTRTWIDATQQWRVGRKKTTFGDYGLEIATENAGVVVEDTPVPDQVTCTTTTYLANRDIWLLNAVQRSRTFAGTCDAPVTSANIVSDTKNSFDSTPYGTPPTVGDVSQTDVLDSWPSGGAEQFQSPAHMATFDEYGRSVTVADHRNLPTRTVYTPKTGGPVTRIATTTPQVSTTDQRTFTSTKELDPVSGAILAETDNSGLRTDAAYDPLARLTAVWSPGHSRAQNQPASTLYEYSVTADTGKVSSIATKTLLANGSYTTSYALVDGLGRTVQTQTPTPYTQGGRTITDTLFDSQGRLYITHNNYWNGASGPSATLQVVQHNAVPNSTFTTYDSAGRTTGSAFVLNGAEQWRTTTRYDGDRAVTIPPAGGIATAAVTNGLGQNVRTVQFHDRDHTGPNDPGDVTAYTYTPGGQLATVTDSTGKNVWSASYDLRGRKTVTTDPDTGKTSYSYDDVDRLATTTDAQNRTLAYSYDNIGRKTGEYQGAVTGTKLAEWTYDTVLAGQPAGSTRYVAGRAYSTAVTGYDAAGRVTGLRYTIPAFETGLGGTYTFNTTYDALSGAVTDTTSPAKGGLPAETIHHDYGTLGQATMLNTAVVGGSPLHLVSNTQYNPQAQVLRTDFQDPTSPYQVAVTNTYENGTGRLATTLAQRATTTGHDITNRTYTYRPDDNLTRLADTPQDGTADVQCFQYDRLQRLTGAWTPKAGDCAPDPVVSGLGGAAQYWTSWDYDLNGNRIRQVQHTTGGDATTTTTYPAPGNPRPHAAQTVTSSAGTTSNTYYDDGRTKTRGSGTAGQTFSYDAEGKLASVTEADGKTSTYVYDADGNRLIARDPSGVTLTVGDLELRVPAGGSFATGTRYYSYNGHPIAERTAATGVSWLLTDEQGTAYASVDAADLTVHKRFQDPYGVPRGTPTGPWVDNHGFLGGYQNPTGLTHLGAREYDPAIGSFTTPDPLLEPGNPAHLNAYTYGFDNPLANPDPTGLEPMLDTCKNAEDRRACANYGYTASTGNASDDRYYGQYRSSSIWACNWSRYCLAKNQDVTRKGSKPPTRERAAAIYREFHNEGMTIQEILELGWQMTGIPDIVDCSSDPTWGACLGAALTVAPYLKAGKAVEALAASEKLGRAARFVGVVDDAARGEDGLADLARTACAVPHSFTGDTRVLMADGTAKPISEIKVGDEIANTSPDAKAVEHHKVTAVHVTQDDHDRVDLLLDGSQEPIRTTEHHQIWETRSHHWVEAGQLRAGDQVQALGREATIGGVDHHDAGDATYDLSVGGLHAYYVLASKIPVLVHNNDPCQAGKLSDALPLGMNHKIAEAYDDVKAGRLTSHDIYSGQEYPWWTGSKEYRVPGRPNTERILEKTLPNGVKVYGWTATHYQKIQRFGAPHFPGWGWK
ncbi:RHS repeat-associated core domain-containing protein [Amycolatopsis sp. NEAU-NG30]|uniref:RHS repeat-associated core domain-containing protein n=1 Tax=Amycolatopsis melonis TaxID=3156488 RepID=A0ABV0L951_9PSEU